MGRTHFIHPSKLMEPWWIPIQPSSLHSTVGTASHWQSLPIVVLRFESDSSLLCLPNSRGRLTSSPSCDPEAPLPKLVVRGRCPLPSAPRVTGHQNCLQESSPSLQDPHNFIPLMWARFRYLFVCVALVSQLTLEWGIYFLGTSISQGSAADNKIQCTYVK